MKTTITTTLMASVVMVASLGAAQLVNEQALPASCEKVGEIQVGDRFNTHAKDIVSQEVIAEAKRLGADKVTSQMIRHDHPKLGASYTSRAVAWKCTK